MKVRSTTCCVPMVHALLLIRYPTLDGTLHHRVLLFFTRTGKAELAERCSLQKKYTGIVIPDTLHRQSVRMLANARFWANTLRRLAAAAHAARHADQTLIQHWPHGRCSAELRFDDQLTSRCRVLRASVLRGGNGPEQWHRKVGETWSTTLLWCSLLVVGDVDAHWLLCVCERRTFTMVALARRGL